MAQKPSQSMSESEIDQLELFVAELVDINTKGDMTSMEYPVFALSTKPDTEIYRFENATTGAWLEIVPSVKGRATIFDKDLLLYTVSQLVEAQNRGMNISRKVRVVAYDFLKATGRRTDGKTYQALHEMLARLRGTTFKSNIEEGGTVGTSRTGAVFGFIDDAAVIERDGRMVAIEITLGERLADAVERRHVLTYDKAYFDLRSPMARRLYEIARKFCGKQASWEISLEKLHARMGARSTLKEFRRSIKKIVNEQVIPGYFITYIPAVRADNVSEKIAVVPIPPVSR